MKLSDIKGERSLDVVADLLDPIYNIASDEKAAVLFKKRAKPDGVTNQEFGAQWLKEAAQKLLKAHKKDCIKILAIIEGVTPKQYTESLNFVKLMADVADLLSDEAFTTLFFSAAQSTETSSGSVLASIGAQSK